MSEKLGHILIVEDEPNLQAQIAEILQFEGYTISIASNGLEGTNKAFSLLPDLILSDISMPDCNGFEFLEQLQSNQKTAIIPFLFLTANSDFESMRTGKKLGADDYLLKPFDQEELLISVKNRLSKSVKTKSIATKEASKQLEQVRYTVSAAMPHEFRTPLSSILGISELLRDRAKQYKPSKISEYSEMIFDAGKRLERLLENYVMYTELTLESENKEPISKERSIWDVTDSIEFHLYEVIDVLAKQYERNNDIVFNIQDASVNVSPSIFRKILTEIIDNALKFSDVGSKVHIQTVINGKVLEVIVKDNGCGMSKVELTKLGAFIQHNRDVREQQGAGLGFSIASILAQKNNCTIHVESEVNSFCCVTIQFPIVDEE
jgi:two-component system sensor histidine kinase/response regulator